MTVTEDQTSTHWKAHHTRSSDGDPHPDDTLKNTVRVKTVYVVVSVLLHDDDSLQDQNFGKQSQVIDVGSDIQAEQRQKDSDYEQKKGTYTTSQGAQTQPLLFTTDPLLQLWEPSLMRTIQDLGDWQDDHAEKDLEECQRGSGQDVSVCRCPLEEELLGH